MLLVIAVDLKKQKHNTHNLQNLIQKHEGNNAELYDCLSQDEAAQIKKKGNTEECTTVEDLSV